jgi:UDP-N-acetylglucosamine:LPS N-acetylglucosamine transferase
MIKLKSLLYEGSKSLRVFDFDDTLAKVDSYIYVKTPNGREKKLNSAEFAVYKPKKGEEFDFRDFNRMLRDPIIIKKNVNRLKKALDKVGQKVTILTARAISYPLNSFFKTLGIKPYVIALGSSNPEHKADWIEQQVKKGYDDIFFIDDSAKNVRAVERRMKKYPHVKLKTIVA